MMRASGGSLTFTDYHYYVELATATEYTPPIHSVFDVMVTNGAWDGNLIYSEYYDGAGWNLGVPTTPEDGQPTMRQDTAQNLRINNTSGVAKKLHCGGYIWS